jgi:hypothetical protein
MQRFSDERDLRSELLGQILASCKLLEHLANIMLLWELYA